ncbi:ABC transporter permease subunit, partial [Turicimonas muris]
MSIDLDFDLIIDNLPLLLKGAAVTLEITALSVGIGLLIGMVVGIARLSNFKAIRWLAGIYVDFIRGTPLLVQIFLVYFALPKILGMR